MLKAEQLCKQVQSAEGDLQILDNVSLEVRRGEAVAIVGPSGSGKSTLLGLLAGLDVPSSGAVWVDGQNISAMDEDGRAAVRASQVGFVFQSFHLLPSLTALENVALPLELTGRQDAIAVARRYLERVGLADRTTHYPRQLSGGEQQRVAVARAFACQPPLLFADEPTGNLDTATGQRINDLLFELNAEAGATLVLVTHSAALAQRCHRILTIERGRLVSKSQGDI